MLMMPYLYGGNWLETAQKNCSAQELCNWCCLSCMLVFMARPDREVLGCAGRWVRWRLRWASWTHRAQVTALGVQVVAGRWPELL